MLLAIDVGNTSIHAGLFDGNRLAKEKRWSTEGISGDRGIRDWGLGNKDIRQVIVASVVPKADKVIRKLFPQAVLVDHKNIGIKIKVKKPSEVGADRLVNALAAHTLYKGPAIIVDFGTATTFDVINAKGEYLGGAIAPGILLARDTLHARTAKLPRIEIKAPRNVIGKDTIEAMESGLVLGYASLVEGMIDRIKKELRTHYALRVTRYKIKVIATGGLAPLICQQTAVIDRIDELLTLKGLILVGSSESGVRRNK